MKEEIDKALGGLAAVLDLPAPPRSCPEDRPQFQVEEALLQLDAFREALETHTLHISGDFGCCNIWKTDQGVSGEKFGYRRVRASFYDVSVEEALAETRYWYGRCWGYDPDEVA